MLTSIVMTTIRKPVLLAEYCRNMRQYAHTDVNFVVIGDKKTPDDVGSHCDDVKRQYGYDVMYYSVERQLEYLVRFPYLAAHLPFNSVQRRNIGLLVAYELGADVIITLDDDNFVTEHDFVRGHSIVGSLVQKVSIGVDSGWFNVCQLLIEEANRPFYHRGYPMGQRWNSDVVRRSMRPARVVVNAGLWLSDPDIDALTRLAVPIHVVGITPEGGQGVLLEPGTWCPFNSQNTAFARDVIPAYFLSPYIGRYDDIWASYFLRTIVDHLGDCVHYGPPLVRQVRNTHDVWRDLDDERRGVKLTDRLVRLLREIRLTEGTYASCYRELAYRLGMSIQRAQIFDSVEQGELMRVIEGMDTWARVFEAPTR